MIKLIARSASLSLVLILAGCGTPQTQPERTAQTLLLDRPAFRQCEAEAFLSLIIARNAIHLGNTKESQLAVKSNGAFAISTIEEVYLEIEKSGTRDHGTVAARKFYQCAKRENLPVPEKLSSAAVCLARQDIEFFVNIDRQRRRPQDEAEVRIKQYLSKSSKTVYPDALIDQIVPMVYRIRSADDEYQLRQMIFETCLLPDDWNAWYNASQAMRQ